MAEKITIFITLTVYLIVSNILLFITMAGIATDRNQAIVLNSPVTEQSMYIDEQEYKLTTPQSNTFVKNMRVLWDIVTIPFEILGGLGIFLMFLFIILPTILWIGLFISLLMESVPW